MPKDLEYGLLCELYGSLLTDKQRELTQLYYDDDLTLSEIAENTGVTRQAVRDALTRTENALAGYEAQLGLLRKTRALQKLAEELNAEGQNALAARIQEILE